MDLACSYAIVFYIILKVVQPIICECLAWFFNYEVFTTTNSQKDDFSKPVNHLLHTSVGSLCSSRVVLLLQFTYVVGKPETDGKHVGWIVVFHRPLLSPLLTSCEKLWLDTMCTNTCSSCFIHCHTAHDNLHGDKLTDAPAFEQICLNKS